MKNIFIANKGFFEIVFWAALLGVSVVIEYLYPVGMAIRTFYTSYNERKV